MDRVVRWFTDPSEWWVCTESFCLWLAEVCGLLLSVFCPYEWVNAQRGLVPVTTFRNCSLSVFCLLSVQNILREASNAHLCINLRKQECHLFIWKLKCGNELGAESKPENDAALMFKPYLFHRGNPFVKNELHTGGLLEAPWSVNAYTWYWHVMLCTVM